MATIAGTPGARRQQQSPRWALRVRALSAALRRGRHGHGAAAAGLPRVVFLRRLYESVVFHLLWVMSPPSSSPRSASSSCVSASACDRSTGQPWLVAQRLCAFFALKKMYHDTPVPSSVRAIQIVIKYYT
jgi:hypothetical protein